MKQDTKLFKIKIKLSVDKKNENKFKNTNLDYVEQQKVIRII